jgi:glucose-6-phosphate isomerase
MDEHLGGGPAETRLPVILAALDLWNLDVLGLPALAVVPYADRLRLLPDYLQQLVMESNGKGVTEAGAPAALPAAPIVWGAPGTDAQHSFFQWLHQGPAPCPVEFVLPVSGDEPRPGHADALAVNCLAQASALMLGRGPAETEAAMAAEGADAGEIARLAPHRTFPGGRPSVTLLTEQVGPESLGALIALWEHRVAAAGFMAGIDPFDQWGVEYGKTMADRLAPLLSGEAESQAPDPATAALAAEIRRRRGV